MDVATYAVEAAVQETHWWFVGRRHLFAREVEAFSLPRTARILDVGTSTGTNLAFLRELGFRSVSGLDMSEHAIAFCEGKGLGPVHRGDACAMPFADASMDLVLATDIIEHLDDDGAGLREITRILAPGGRALITVPAFQALWGLQDNVAHHRRRYRMGLLKERVSQAGLVPRHAYYFNYLLFAPIWAARQVLKIWQPKVHSENEINAPWLNAILSAMFAFDVRTAPALRPPFGVSILMVAERPREPTGHQA
jgi:SAM-dependent methyltransferase